MANQEHLEILQQGVNMWNTWRKDNPKINPDLSGANLTKTDLVETDLSRTNLVEADLSVVDLLGADLAEADLSRVDLRAAVLRMVNLTKTNFKESILAYTIFASCDLSQAKNLETCVHQGPNSIDYYTLMRSKNIPKKFLHGIGMSSKFIDYLPSFQTNTWQFYTCFISYTEKDNEFSIKLYHDLQEAGIRCWRWREDATWGRKVRREVDQAVFTYDKLVVICSKNSLNSPQVIREIERAIQKEDELHKDTPEVDVLFPLRIDDYVLEWNNYLKPYLLENFIADFRSWENQKKYRESFERLIAALKKEGERFS